MRIFYAVAGTTPLNHWTKGNLYPALIEMGHEVIVFDWESRFMFVEGPYWYKNEMPKLNEELLSLVQKEHLTSGIDLFYGYLSNRIIYPETIEEIRKLGIPTVNFSCNNIHQFHLVDKIVSHFDYCMVPEYDALQKYKAAGANPLYIQMAANPHVYHPYDLKKEYDVTFVGSRYATRPDIIRYLRFQKIDVKVWGAGWLQESPGDFILSQFTKESIKRKFRKYQSWEGIKKSGNDFLDYFKKRNWFMKDILSQVCGPLLPFEETIKMFSRSRISLGFTCLDVQDEKGQPLKHIRLREFEAPMSGAFYLVEYLKELENFYQIGKEIICYQTKEELVEKVRYYLSHPSEVERIRMAGYERAKNDHTWVNRFQQLFKAIGIGGND